MATPGKRAPPQLVFDDGSRVMTEEPASSELPIETPKSLRGATSLEEYYELDRICKELENYVDKEDETFRVALQFPDELLDDSPEVCWMFEDKLASMIKTAPLVFCLGDTTVGSCCPDEVAALHLQAHVMVHYGHACLSPTGTLPVIYGFGRLSIDVEGAVGCVSKQQDSVPKKILLLYEVGYHHAIGEFQSKLSEACDALVVTGQIPRPTEKRSRVMLSGGCCDGKEEGQCCKSADTEPPTECTSDETQEKQAGETTEEKARPLVVGGLELPETFQSWDELQHFTILFVGDAESTSQRQYVNVMLHFQSLPSPPENYWTYSPRSNSLTTSIPTAIQKQLNRRFFLSQKARDAHVYGILVSNLSQQHLVDVVKSLKRRIQDAGKSSYSFAVGKINPAKLANFAEIECFVLVACREHALLDNERDYPVPVITPLELDVALGNLTWGAQVYSLDCQDVLQSTPGVAGEEGSQEEDDDAPYFSLVTGKYVQKAATKQEPLDLEHLPGQGQVAAYNSEAAKFLGQREYQGLNTLAGQTEAKAAVVGQRGIASNYAES